MAFDPYAPLASGLTALGNQNRQNQYMDAAGQGLEGALQEPPADHVAAQKAGSVALKSTADMLTRAKEYWPLVQQASAKYGVPPEILMGQLQQESGFDPNARGKAGEIGISQFMPRTAKQFNVNPIDPASSIDGQARYMADNYKRTKNWGAALALYNSGTTQDPTYVKSVGANAAKWSQVFKSGALGGQPQGGQQGGATQENYNKLQALYDQETDPGQKQKYGAALTALKAQMGQQGGGQPQGGAPQPNVGPSEGQAPLPSDNPGANLNNTAGSAFGPGFTLQGLVKAIKAKNPNIKPRVLAGAINYLQPLLSQQGQLQWHALTVEGQNQRAQATLDQKDRALEATLATRVDLAGMSLSMRKQTLDQAWTVQQQRMAQGAKRISQAQFNQIALQWSRLQNQLEAALRTKVAATNTLTGGDQSTIAANQSQIDDIQGQMQAIAQQYGFDPDVGPVDPDAASAQPQTQQQPGLTPGGMSKVPPRGAQPAAPNSGWSIAPVQ